MYPAYAIFLWTLKTTHISEKMWIGQALHAGFDLNKEISLWSHVLGTVALALVLYFSFQASLFCLTAMPYRGQDTVYQSHNAFQPYGNCICVCVCVCARVIENRRNTLKCLMSLFKSRQNRPL